MKIVCIFAEELFAFQYNDESENEYDRLMELWTNVAYLTQFAIENNVDDIRGFVKKRLRDAENIQDMIEEIVSKQNPLEWYFGPLDSTETGWKELSMQKGKIKNNGLRLYALKIDENTFVITGGAIKMSQLMKDHPGTQKELDKLSAARQWLIQNGVMDQASFFEFLGESNV